MLISIKIAFYEKKNSLEDIKEIINELKKQFGNNYTFKVKRVPLNGLFYASPIIILQNQEGITKYYENVTLSKIKDIVKTFFDKKKKENKYKIFTQILPQFGKNIRSFNDYVKEDGYSFIKTFSKDKIFSAIEISKLKERSGKEEYVYQKIKKFVNKKKVNIVCNLELSRVTCEILIDSNPHQVLDGMLIVSYLLNSRNLFFMVNAKNKQIIETLQKTIYEIKENGILKNSIFHNNLSIIIKKNFGSILLGEESILKYIFKEHDSNPEKFSDDKFFIMDAETFANISFIINKGEKNFKKYGIEKSYGTKLVFLSGEVKRSAVFEVELGLTLKELIEKYGEGVISEKKIKAVQIGGLTGTIIPASLLKTPYDYDYLKEIDAFMGTGEILVLSNSVCMVDYLLYLTDIFAKENCGKCISGRIGIKRINEIIKRIAEGEAELDDIRVLKKLILHLGILSECNFGKNIANLLGTSLKYFKDEFIEHITKKRCRAIKCNNLVKYKINNGLCNDCEECINICPTSSIYKNNKNEYVIDNKSCVKCDVCVAICEKKAIIKYSRGEKYNDKSEN